MKKRKTQKMPKKYPRVANPTLSGRVQRALSIKRLFRKILNALKRLWNKNYEKKK